MMSRPTLPIRIFQLVWRVMRRTLASTSTSASKRAMMLARNIPLIHQCREATKMTLNTPMPRADRMPTMTKARLLPKPRKT